MGFKGALPIILTGISVVSTIASVFLAIDETPKAVKLLDDHRLEIDPTGETDLTTKEKVKDYAQTYWPTAATLALAVGTGIASCAVSQRQIKGLIVTTAGLSAAYAKHKDKIKEIIGEEKAKLLDSQVKEEISEEREACLHDENKYWFYEPLSDTAFQMTMSEFYDAKCEANKILHLSSEGVKLGDIFPQVRKNSPKTAKSVWTEDYILEHQGGYNWLDIDFKQINVPGTENAPTNWEINSGRETRVIEYSIWPLTEKIAKDCGYLSPIYE